MAELLIKIGSHGSGLDEHYRDGDIVCAFSQRRIRSTHAQHICDHRKFGFNGDGLRPVSIAEKYLDATRKYKFVRVSKYEVVRYELGTLFEETFSKTPNAKGEQIDVPLYISRRIKDGKHKIFGTKGAEYWYGGPTKNDNVTLDSVWLMIETDTANREADHALWPLTSREKKGFLAIGVDDFDLGFESRLVATEANWLPGMSGYTEAVGTKLNYKRRAAVNWQALGLGNAADIQNPDIEVDVRVHVQTLSNIAIYRPRKTIWTAADRDIAGGRD